MNIVSTCHHFEQPPNGLTLSATCGPFICPWCETERLHRELQHFASSGIVEIAVRNPSVRHYMEHWESRTLRAEADRDRLRIALERATATFADLTKGLRLLNRPLIADACELAEKECRTALTELPMAAAAATAPSTSLPVDGNVAAVAPSQENDTITSLCDRLDRIHLIALDRSLHPSMRLEQIREWSGGFARVPGGNV